MTGTDFCYLILVYRIGMRKTGLREKPSYDQLISEIDVDQLVGYPDRRAKQMIDSPYLSNLFNNGSIDLEDQAQLR